MRRLMFEDPLLIFGILVTYVSSVLLWGIYGCPPYKYQSWPLEPNGLLDNIFVTGLFWGVSLIFASTIIEKIESRHSNVANDALCRDLCRLVSMAYMYIINNDIRLLPRFENPLPKLYYLSGRRDASKEMEVVLHCYNTMFHNDLQTSISEGRPDIVPRVKTFLKATEIIRRNIGTIHINRAILASNDNGFREELVKYEDRWTDFEELIAWNLSNEDYYGIACQIDNILIYTGNIYMELKGKHLLHRSNGFYGPEDPPEFWI